MIKIKNILTDVKSFFFLILILITIFYSLKNGSVVTVKFFFSNIAIRQGFFEENNVNYKGTHDPGKRFLKLFYNNYRRPPP